MVNVEKHAFKARLLVAVITVLMVFGNVVTPLSGSFYVYAAPREAGTWKELREAISASASGDTILIKNDIQANSTDVKGGTINVSGAKTITIKAKDTDKGVTIYRKEGDADFPMFKTSNDNAGIILGEGLTLSGQTSADCPKPAPASGFNVISSNGGNPEKTATKTINAGQEVYVNRPAADWTPETGYDFVGWSYKTSTDGAVQSTKGKTDPASTGFILPQNKSGEMKLVAEYERTNFVVIWSNGDSDNEKTLVWDLYEVDGATKKSVGDSLSLTPDDDWKPGDDYTFAGWKYILSDGTELTSSNGNVVDKNGNPVKMTKTAAEMKIVAQWTKSGGNLNYDGKEFYLCYAGQRINSIGVFSNPDSNYYEKPVSVTVEGGEAYFTRESGEKKKIVVYRGDLYLAMGWAESSPGVIVETDPSNPNVVYLKDNQGNYFGDYNSSSYKWDKGETKTNRAWSLGGGSSYKSSNPSYTAKEPEKYPTSVQPTYSESTGPSGQGCDGTCSTYTEDDFSSGTTDAPRGFFVEVAKGTVTLQGATLENFNTSNKKDDTPKNVAPVVASGSTAKFIVNSGKIQNNIVGYLANDDNSTNGANQIKKYIKGAAPNARRKNAPEPADGTKQRRNSPAGIDGGNPGSGITGTAGAIIYANGAKGEISGGSIGYNRADTGGVMVTDNNSFVEIKTGADINNNVGVQFGGGVFVEQGGAVYMSGGEIRENVAWFGGGGVFATENGIDWLIGQKSMSKSDRKDGYFTMAGGKVYGNNAFTRGGGFLVDSNGVSLEAGEIYNNTSRVLGGGAYVMGDHPDYSYTLYIAKGEITNNEARTADNNEPTKSDTAMSKKLKKATTCPTDTPDSLFGDSMGGTSDDIADFQRINDGTGGGVWTCSYGSTVLDLDSSKVWIHDNNAEGATGDPSRYSNKNKRLEEANKKNKKPAGGQDFHSDNGGDGTLLMINAETFSWYDENAKSTYTPGEVDAEIRNLTFQGSGSYDGGVKIYNNSSRRGGGLAADGTFVFGAKHNVARVTAELEIAKVWEEDVEKKPVVIRVGVESGDKKAIVEDLELDGTANSTDEESSHENSGTDTEWSGGFNLPVSVDDDQGNRITVFKIKGPNGTIYDPTKDDDMTALASALENSDGSGFTLSSDAKLTFTELVKVADGKYEETGEYNFEPGEVEISNLSLTVRNVTRVNAQGETEHVLSVSFAKIPLTAPLRNKAPGEEPKTEKYVDNKVHSKIVNFDQDFTYSVMAYVPKNATEVTITDTLKDDLEFIYRDAEKTKVITEIKFYSDNDSKGNGEGTVATGKVDGNNVDLRRGADGLINKTRQQNKPEAERDYAYTVEGNKLTLILKEGFLQTADDALFKKQGKGLDGVWIKVSFKAQIKDDANVYQKLVDKIESGNDATDTTISWEKVTNDKSTIPVVDGSYGEALSEVTEGAVVETDGSHAGLANQAEYKVTIPNSGKSTYKTNTVTVEPETENVYVKKAWKNEKGVDATWPTDVLSVKVNVYRVEEGKEDVTVDTITVTSANNNDPPHSIALPKLKKASYTVDEVEIPGYREVGSVEGTGTEDDPYIFTNQKNGGPQIEKYVNNKVHQENNNFDTSFKYDIIAFVPKDADEIVIKDTLVNALEFAKAPEDEKLSNYQTVAAEKSTNPDDVVTGIVVKENNDHTVNSTVKDGSGTPLGDAADPEIGGTNNKTLTVTIKNAEPYRGKYVQVTFWAKYTDEMIKAAQVGDSKTITGNGAVLGGQKTHTGTTNDASYDIKVGNEWTEDVKSNTVTVTSKTTKVKVDKVWVLNGEVLESDKWPEGATVEVKLQSKKGDEDAQDVEGKTETLSADQQSYTFDKLPCLVGVTYSVAEGNVENKGPYTIGQVQEVKDGEFKITNTAIVDEPEIEKYVNKAVHDYINLDEVFTYDVIAYVSKNADKLTITDQLVADLEFVSTEEDIKIYDLGTENNHKPAKNVEGAEINSDATVDSDSTEVTGEAVSKKTDDNKLTVTIDDGVNKTTGERTNTTVENLRGHWVKVTFKAQIKKELQDKINSGEMSIYDLTSVTVKGGETYKPDDSIFGEDTRPEPNVGNAPVDSDETHSGIDNTASYVIETYNDGEYKDESNTVTVKPELPEIEKYVNKAVHKNIMLDEVFTYDIIGFITRDADEVVFEDQLVPDLEFTNTDSIKVVSLDEDNHKPLNDINGSTITDNTDASVAQSGTDITDSVDVDTSNGKLTVTIDGADTVQSLRGKYVKITFKAQIKKAYQDAINAGTMKLSDLSSVTIEDNGPVLSDETHEGIKNEASMKIKVENDWKYEPKSNTVTVKPEKPEIEKYINQAVHEEISLDDEFTYDVIAYVTKNADKFTITDKLVSDLEFVSTDNDVKVVDLGTEDNHKPTNDIEGKKVNNDATVAKRGTNIKSKAQSVKITGDTLTVVFDDGVSVDGNGVITRQRDDVLKLRGHWVKVTFMAQIKEEYRKKIKAGKMSLEDLKYVTVKADEKYKTDSSIYGDGENRPVPNVGNDPVESVEDHTGIENTASYVIEVANSGEFKDESNTVTVRPNYPEIEKYVSQAVHDYIKLDEVFTYDVLAYVTTNADKVTISDNLVADLEFADAGNIKLYDLGTENNHLPVNNVEGMKVNDDATVAESGTEITEKDGVTITAEDGKLKVVLDDGVSKITGDRTHMTVKNLRGHWIKVTFDAQIKKELQDMINAGKMTLSDLSSVTIKKNDPVLSNEEHTGIGNKAGYEIETANDGKYEDESNTVTVKPEKPEIEKYVDKVVHKDITVDKKFTYDVIAYVTNDADKVTITDPLVEDLEFVSTADDVKLVDLGKATAENVDHEPNGAAVNAEGTEITGDAVSKTIDGNTLTIVIDDEVSINADDGTKKRNHETVLGLRGHWVKVTFDAKIKDGLTTKDLEYTKIDAKAKEDRAEPNVGNDPVKVDEDHTGVKNTASYDIEINNTGEYKSEYADTSNTVTVKPEEPEIEKYVNQAVHDYIKLEEVFTYDVIAYITKDADKVVITDELDSQLQFESKEGAVKVVDLGTENNHKVTNDINAKKVNKDASVAEKGKAISKKTVSINGNKLTVTLEDSETVTGLRGHWVKVTFDAKIKDGLTTKDLEYTKIDAKAKEDRAEPNVGNDPVVSDETHDGVPNKAAYTIGVKNDADVIEDKYKDESNTVTVKPEEFDVEVSKQDLEGNELPGAKITITDENGKVVDTWTSEDKPHKLRLKPGKYKMKEVVAPEGFNRVTTEIEFEVDKDGKVKVLTATVDNGGKIEVLDINHLVLTDAPTPTISKKVNGLDETEVSSSDEVFAYDITARIAYVPEESFVIEDNVPSELEIVSPDSVTILVNDEELSREEVNKILTINGNLMKVAPTLAMMKEWGPFEMKVTFICKIRDDANIRKGESIKNVAVLKVDGEYVEPKDGEDEARVLAEYESKKPKKRGANTGDENAIPFLIFAFLASALAFEVMRRRRMN